jgi:hypothetical protein
MATRNDDPKQGLVSTASVYNYYSDKYINYMNSEYDHIEEYEKCINLKQALKDKAWGIDYIDWSTDKDHITFTCEHKDKDLVVKTLIDFINDLTL